MDCIEGMKEFPDKYFQLAITDPPYGIGADKKNAHSSIRDSSNWANKNWDSEIPSKEYFDELFRVSVNQIIWGGNYFLQYLRNTSCFLIWNKLTRNFSLADAELAWTSFPTSVRCFDYQRNDFNEKRISPTQKPVALYKWLLTNYAKQGDSILDTHLGSGSSRIAAYDLGFDFTGYELDADYFQAQEERFARHIAQPKLFEPVKQIETQESLFI